MSLRKTNSVGRQDFLKVDSNQELVLKLLRSYYRSHQTSGKLYDECPDFFLVAPDVLKDSELAERASDQLILNDCVQRAQERKGNVGVSKWRNHKLNYHWLELSVFPFMLGDDVTQNNQGEFFYILSQFIDYTKNNPKMYGDLTAEINSDKDLALMLAEINKRGQTLQDMSSHYPQDMLLSYSPNWPIGEVNKLLKTLKATDQSWCEVFFEYILYVMKKKQ
jgi:hypothetical protein